jgi:cell division protein FtsQ
MVGAGAATWGVASSPAFGVRSVDVSGVSVTSEAAIQAVLALGSPPPNAFTLATDELRSGLEAIPSIAEADVRVDLPGMLRVRVVERVPILAWRTGRALLLVDRDGTPRPLPGPLPPACRPYRTGGRRAPRRAAWWPRCSRLPGWATS